MDKTSIDHKLIRLFHDIYDDGQSLDDTAPKAPELARLMPDLLKRHPEDAKLNSLWGRYLRRTDPAAALPFLERAQRYFMNSEDLRTEIAFCHFETENYDKALPELLRALKVHPKDEYLQFMAGYCHFKAGDIKTAKPYLTAAFNTLSAADFPRQSHDIMMTLLNDQPHGVTPAKKHKKNKKKAKPPKP